MAESIFLHTRGVASLCIVVDRTVAAKIKSTREPESSNAFSRSTFAGVLPQHSCPSGLGSGTVLDSTP